MARASNAATQSHGPAASADAASVERSLQRASCRARDGCYLVEACLRHRGGRDHGKAFFERVFPALVGRIVGVQGDAWLNAATEADAEALLRLLRAEGALLHAIREADVHQEVRFAFPTKWLPKRTQLLLRSEEGCRILGQMPHYASHLASDGMGGARVQVSLFEYLGFWLAVFATKGSARPARDGQGTAAGIVHEFTSAAHFVKDIVTHHHSTDGKPLYQRLLEQLLDDYLSSSTCRTINQAAIQGFQGDFGGVLFADFISSARGGSSSILAMGNSLLNILLDFWLSDASDVIDLQLRHRHPALESPDRVSPGVQSPFTSQDSSMRHSSPIRASQSMAAYAYQPPSKDLCNAVRLLVTHLLPSEEGPGPANQESNDTVGGWPSDMSPLRPQKLFQTPARYGSGSEHVPTQGCQTFVPLQKPLYRFLRKAFLLWPEETTASMSPIADVWLTYIAPWRAMATEWDARFKPRSSPKGQQVKSAMKTNVMMSREEWRNPAPEMLSGGFNAYWRSYVVQNLPFYNLLLYYFIETTCKRAQYHSERAVRNLVIVLRALDASPGLVDLMKDAEEAYAKHLNDSNAYGQPAHSLTEFMPLLASQLDTWEIRQEGSSPDFNLFSSERVKKMLHALLVRIHSDAVHKLPTAVSERYRNLLKDSIKQVFGYEVSNASLESLEEQHSAGLEYFGDKRAWCLPKHSWKDVAYRGDSFDRPICSNEVAWLVRILVRWSNLINARLGLGGGTDQREDDKRAHWIVAAIRKWANRRQLRVNLRPLAEVQSMGWLAGLGLIVFLFLWS